MKDVLKINSNLSSNLLYDEIFWNKNLLDIKHFLDTTHRTYYILDNHYENSTYIRLHQKVSVHQKKIVWCSMIYYMFLFDGTLDTWKTEPVDIELQPGDKIYHAKTHPVKGTWTHIKEVIGGSFLTRVTWIMKWIILGTPHLYPNNNNGADRFLSDIRKLIR